MGSILDKVEKDAEDISNLYLYLYLRYIFGQPVSYQYLQILGRAKDKIFFKYLLSYQQSHWRIIILFYSISKVVQSVIKSEFPFFYQNYQNNTKISSDFGIA